MDADIKSIFKESLSNKNNKFRIKLIHDSKLRNNQINQMMFK